MTLRHEANALLADESPGARLDVLEGSSKPAEPVSTQGSKKTQIEFEFGKAGRNLLKARLNLTIVKLICAATLPPIVVDTQEWKDMFSIANNTYRPHLQNTPPMYRAVHSCTEHRATARSPSVQLCTESVQLCTTLYGLCTDSVQTLYNAVQCCTDSVWIYTESYRVCIE